MYIIIRIQYDYNLLLGVQLGGTSIPKSRKNVFM